MANVLFKRGTEPALLGLGTYIDGCFYLTTDTNRLFVGKGTALVPVNEGVITVDNVAALPATGIAGAFYYAKGENILCVYNGAKWVQINANTNEYYKVTDVTLNKATDTANKKITLTSVITMKKYDNSTGTPSEVVDSAITVTSNAIEITNSDFKALIEEASVGLVQSLADQTFTLKNEGTGANATKIAEIVAGTNVSFKATTNGIEISSVDTNTTYSVIVAADGTDKAVITYKEVNGTGDDQTVAYTASDKLNVSVIDGAITFGHDTANVERPVATVGTINANREFTVVTGVEDDGYGHMSKVVTQKFTLPDDKDVYVTEATYNEATGATNGTLTLKRQGETDIVATLGLTAEEIDKRINSAVSEGLESLSALNYKGTVGTGGTITALPETAAAGDMYMAAYDSVVGEPVAYEQGDLIIAVGKEVNGVIGKDDLAWTVVPSGNDLHTDTQFSIQAAAATNGASLQLYNDTSKQVDTTVNLTDDDVVNVAHVSETEIKISHANKTVEKVTGEEISGEHGGSFNVITGVEADEKGHLSKVTTSTIALPADKDTKSSISAGVTSGVGAITLTETLDGQSTTDKVEIVSGTDVVIEAGNTDQIKVSHVTHKGEKTTNEVTATHAGKEIIAVSDMTIGTNGHIDAYKLTTYQLPSETTYDLSGSVSAENNVATFNTVLTDNNKVEDTVSHSISSDSLNITASGNNVAIEMVWGSF